VAVTLSGNTGTLYVNGQPVATNTNMTVTPADLGNTNQNWIGLVAAPWAQPSAGTARRK
jgi:cytochrome c